MHTPVFTKYFNWVQKDNPTGTVDNFPELKDGFETSVAGIYCVGDLTGIPLIKLAAESGYKLIEKLKNDELFTKDRERNKNSEIKDLIIVGAGPAGVSACLYASELGFSHVVIEAAQVFNTIKNFPTGKPIYVTPEGSMRSDLKFTDGNKESLLDELADDVKGKPLPIQLGETVKQIRKNSDYFEVETSEATYKSLRVIVAIGKTGNARQLKVSGEELPKVFTRLIDPGAFHEKNIVVVGGGDSAIEAAVALANSGNSITLSYRKQAFSRPKEHNVNALNDLTAKGKITILFESSIKTITATEITINTKDGEQTIENDAVFALIGTEIPIKFFNRSKIKMEGDKSFNYYMQFALLILFSAVLYFGKKAPTTPVSNIKEFLTIPMHLSGMAWMDALKAFLAWASFILMIGSGITVAAQMIINRKQFLTDKWSIFKYSYYTTMVLLFGAIYLSHNLQGHNLLNWSPGVWYSAMYSLTIVIFGLRRIFLHPTGYIKRQTYTLMAFQVIPLFILPIFVLPFMGSHGWFSSWVMTNVFPNEAYWHAYGFILAWPLFIHNIASHEPILFWLILSLIQTFIIIPIIVYKWGKGAYCGWICSCGALAETLGDEYRTKALHGPAAKKADNAGQIVLLFATIMTVFVVMHTWGGISVPGEKLIFKLYEMIVDIFLAGVLGVGVYFFLSGRVWCRFFCPLAALMHIYARFSPYRIFADKKRCISCNICTKSCHMGIDVMGYANKGIPMNDVECVRCSSCIISCPMQVLTFGDVGKVDLNNVLYKEKEYPLPNNWTSGLS